MAEPLKVKLTETIKVSAQIHEIRVSDRVLSSTSAQQLANPPQFPILKK